MMIAIKYFTYIPVRPKPIRGQVSTPGDAGEKAIVIAAPNDITACPYFNNSLKSFLFGSNGGSCNWGKYLLR